MKVCTLPTFAVKEQVYVDRPPLCLFLEDKKALNQYNGPLSCTTRPFTVIGGMSHVIKIEEDGIPNTIYIDRNTPVPTKTYGAVGVALNIEQHPRTTVLNNIYTEQNGPSEYVADRVVDHRHTSVELEYKICRYEYP